MPIAETLSGFLQEVGAYAVSGTLTGWGILDMPSDVLVGDMVMSTNYTFLCERRFSSLTAGASITVNSEAYTVREARLVDDGGLVELSLQKT